MPQIYGGRSVEEKVNRLMDSKDGALVAVLLSLWLRTQRDLTDEEILAAFAAKNFTDEFYQKQLQSITKIAENEITPAQLATATIAGKDIARAIARFTGKAFQFDPTAQYIQAFLRGSGAELITSITANTRLALQRLLLNTSVSPIKPPLELARIIKQSVGILPRHALAVDRIYDVTYARAIKGGATDAAAKLLARKQAQKKSISLLNYRSKNIARTEIHRAWAFAQTETVLEARRRGLFGSAQVFMTWLTAVDERVCEICGPMEGETVPLGSPFSLTRPLAGERVPLEETIYIHAHPSCRCTGIIEVRG